jgi:hypothetical protein
MVEQRLTTTVLSMTSGTSRTAGCTNTSSASSQVPTRLSNISLCGLSFNCWNLEVHLGLKDFWRNTNLTSSHLDPQLISNIRASNLLIPNIRTLASSHPSTPASSAGTPRSHRSQTHSYQETDTGEGQSEIQMLAKRILDFVDGDIDVLVPASVPSSHIHPGSSVSGSMSGRDHEELRKSVRDAFSSTSPYL